jgi:hypothetical protein
VNRWVQVVGLFLIILTLVIVIMPEFDLPPTLTRSPGGTHKTPLIASTAIVHSTVAPPPQYSRGLPLRIAFPDSGILLASLIDLNCSRLC